MTATSPTAPTRSGPLVPRVFHRIWLGGPLPEQERRYGETWAKHHPGWEMRLWHDGNLPPLVNQAQFDTADSAAQKADILRYELLYRHGGVYVDTDFECFRTIEPLIDGIHAFAGREDGRLVSNRLLGCVPGHPFFAAVVAALPDSVAWRPGRPPNEQTGPELLTRILIEREALGLEVPSVFAPELFFPYHWSEPHRAGDEFPQAYASHHWARSRTSAAGISPGVATVLEVVTAAGAETVPVVEAARVVVEIDPARFTEAGAAVLATAVETVGAADGVELALVVRGVREVTQELGAALQGIITTIATTQVLPEIVAYGESDGATLAAAVRIMVTDDPAENEAAVLALAGWAAS